MGFAEKLKSMVTGYNPDEYEEDEEFEEEEYYEEEPKRKMATPSRPIRQRPAPSVNRVEGTSNTQIVSIHTSVQMQVVMGCPQTLEEGGQICDYLRDNKIVIVNLETVPHDMAQRIVDFLGGVSYAIDGDIQSISNKVFIIAPSNVDISGHFKEELKANGILFNFKKSFK